LAERTGLGKSVSVSLRKNGPHFLTQFGKGIGSEEVNFSESWNQNLFEFMNLLKPREVRFQKTVLSAVFFCGISRQILKT